MSMPLGEIIVGIPGFKTSSYRYEGKNIIIKTNYTGKAICPHCGCAFLRLKDQKTRRVRHGTILSHNSYLELKSRKYRCLRCDRYFNERLPGILPYKRSTEKFRNEVFRDHQDGICQKTLRNRLRISHSTIERWTHDYLGLKVSKSNNYPCPSVIGIDEHFFTKKKGYATTICDLKNRRVYDVTLGRSENALEPYMNSLKGKERVTVVVMDLSEAYKKIALKHFSNAKIVADRFHVVRLINHHFLRVWQQIDPRGRKNRGLLSLMRRHEHNLSEKQKMRLDAYLEANQPMKRIYFFKQELTKLMLIKNVTKRKARELLPKFLSMIEELKYCKLESLETLGNTLDL